MALLVSPADAQQALKNATVIDAGTYSFSDELGGFHILSLSGKGTEADPIVITFQATTTTGWADEGFGIDNVVVGADLTTPVPAALPLFLTGLAALGLLARRRKKPALAA